VGGSIRGGGGDQRPLWFALGGALLLTLALVLALRRQREEPVVAAPMAAVEEAAPVRAVYSPPVARFPAGEEGAVAPATPEPGPAPAAAAAPEVIDDLFAMGPGGMTLPPVAPRPKEGR
jgi:LPXTG-motif cell wall-anchored protein